MGIIYILPETLSADRVEQTTGPEYVCPYCARSSVQSKGRFDTGWISIPMRTKTSDFICLGCAIDIYITCASDEYQTSPCRSIVEEAAEKERLPVHQFRLQCLQHQLDMIRSHRLTKDNDEASDFEAYLIQIMRSANEELDSHS